MTIIYSPVLLIVLALLFGLLLGWLLNWLLDGLFRRRYVKVVETRQDCPPTHHEPETCHENGKKKVGIGLGNCEAKYFVIEPERLGGGTAPRQGNGRLDLPSVRPCFELRWGDSEHDRLETKDEESLCIVARNPYTNVIFKNLTVSLLTVTHKDGSPEPNLPDDTPAIAVNPTQLLRFGDLGPANPQKSNPAASSICEVTLISKGAAPGEHRFKLYYECAVVFTMQQTDQYHLPITDC